MDRTIPIELTNMIMIENPKTKEILVEDRKNPAWPGVTVPGGQIEKGETIVASVIREAFEETGLHVNHLRFVGIKEWPLTANGRYIVMLFKTNHYYGDIKTSREGHIFWTTREALKDMVTPPTFMAMLPVFDQPTISELSLDQTSTGETTLNWL